MTCLAFSVPVLVPVLVLCCAGTPAAACWIWQQRPAGVQGPQAAHGSVWGRAAHSHARPHGQV